MAVAELEVGPASAAPVDFGVAGFLQESVRRCQKMAALKRIQVVVEPEAAGTARGDPQRLRQVIDNLLSNAIKYSPLGSLVRYRPRRRAAAGVFGSPTRARAFWKKRSSCCARFWAAFEPRHGGRTQHRPGAGDCAPGD